MTITDDDGSLRLGLAGALGLGEPLVAGNRITYEDVYPGVDLAFEVAGKTVKEYLVLHQPPPLPDHGDETSFRFPLELEELTAEQRADGEIVLLTSSGEVAFEIPKLWMFDSSGDDTSGEPALSEDLSLALESEGETQYVRVTADFEWLSAPERVYPVTIDPTVVKEPELDTFVQSDILNTPQDSSTELKSGTFDGGATKARSLIRFKLDNVMGTTINFAKLSLFNNHSWSCTARRVQVHRVTDSWGSNVTWTN
ncbi:MAG: DNRLRE domain-containing protein, partial [Actinomycetota bacterium]